MSYPISTQTVHSPTLAHMLWVDCAVSHVLSGSGLARDELNAKWREREPLAEAVDLIGSAKRWSRTDPFLKRQPVVIV